MKELTIEQKAKAYDEAIKKAKDMLSYKEVRQEDIEYLFPELKESEDERIRKAIIKGLIAAKNNFRTISSIKIDDAIAWLEKQGEHSENNEDDVDIDFTVYHPLKNGKGIYECIPYSFYGTLSSFDEDKDMIDFLHLCFYTEEECNEWIKQNESIDTCDSLIIKSKEFPASE